MEVGVAPTALDGDVDLLVVGGPTHAFGMSRPGTRQSAAQQSQRGLVSARTGLREWLGRLPGTSRHVAVATLWKEQPGRWWTGNQNGPAAGGLSWGRRWVPPSSGPDAPPEQTTTGPNSARPDPDARSVRCHPGPTPRRGTELADAPGQLAQHVVAGEDADRAAARVDHRDPVDPGLVHG
jgi:hypothetical protein